MVRSIEHRFCDCCGEIIQDNDPYMKFMGKDYHKKCAFDGIRNIIIGNATIDICSQFNPAFPESIVVHFQDVNKEIALSTNLKTALDIINSTSMPNVCDIAYGIVSPMLNKSIDVDTIGSILDDACANSYIHIRFAVIDHVAMNRYNTVANDMSVDAWINTENDSVVLFGASHSKMESPIEREFGCFKGAFDWTIDEAALIVKKAGAVPSVQSDQDCDREDNNANGSIYTPSPDDITVLNPGHTESMTEDRTNMMFKFGD